MSALALSLICILACDKDEVEQRKLTRGGDKPPVVVIGQVADNKNSIAEVEPNGELEEAQALVVDSSMRGVLEGSDDVDRYLLVPEVSGMLFAELSGAGEADVMLSIADADGDVLAKSDRGPSGTIEGLPGFGVEAKTTYHLVVGEFVGRKLRKAGGREGASAPYRLAWRIEEDAEEGFEREPNAEIAGASEILTGEERRGYVGWSGDSDLWRMPVPDSGEVRASGTADSKEALHIVLSPVPGVATTLALLSPDGSAIAERRASKGQELALRNFIAPVGIDSYTIRVGGKPSNPLESYMLRVDVAEIGPGTEEEPNDSLALATPLGGDDSTLQIARGELTRGDVDIFQLSPVTYDRILDLRLSGPGDADLDVAIVAESGAIVTEAVSEGAGLLETLKQVPVNAGDSPLLRVVAKVVKAPAEYELSLSLVRGTAPAIPATIAPVPELPNSPSQPE